MSEDPWDDWETAADAGLIDCKEVKKAPTSNQALWEKANTYTTPVIIHTNNDIGRSEYKPEMKILKRPEGMKNTRTGDMTITTNKNSKGLAEREKDYEEAKRRIDEKFKNKQK